MQSQRDTEPEYRNRGREANAEAMQMRRKTNPQHRQSERTANSAAMSIPRIVDFHIVRGNSAQTMKQWRSRRKQDDAYNENQR
ncbi:unnamed protein product [Gongylonema pulchrum]|uniref:Uncharacterized protein n=1 Tax=Gongylonema pulchrum TaxID=637853 RepID=A0A183DQJ4_9BILA|nr:unnamed protein product [Gongylonema pulchrum]